MSIMVKEIKIIDDDNNEIIPVKNMVCLPFKANKEFISVEEAENIIRILRSQINILRVQNVSKTSDG